MLDFTTFNKNKIFGHCLCKAYAFVEAENKIKVEVAGTYSFYFKAYDASYEVFISKPEVAFADAWAQSFLSGNCTVTKENWSDYEDEFD